MIRVVGCGNLWRRDDGAGPAVALRLKELRLPGVEVQVATGEAMDLLERLRGAERAIVVDAMRAGLKPGSVRRFRTASPLRACRFPSSHAFGVAHAVALGRSLGVLTQKLEVYGIEGLDFSDGEGLSPQVERAVARLARRLSRRCTNTS